MDSPEESSSDRQKQAKGGNPVLQGQRETEECEKRAGIGRVTNKAIRARCNQLMSLRDGDIDGEEPAEVKDRVPAQCDSCDKQGHAQKRGNAAVRKRSDLL